MRINEFCLSLGLGLLAAVPTAQAADWNNGAGGLKDQRAMGVPVPAPIPVVETFKWYLRADVGGGIYTGGNPTAKGDIYGFDQDPALGSTFGQSSTWFNNGFDTFAVGGVGVGAYLSPRIRADATVDARTKNNVDADGNFSYTGDPALYTAPFVGAGDVVHITGSATERTQVHDTVALFNLYYDLTERGSRFVPYVGAGVGFAVRTIDRRIQATESIIDTTTNTLVGTTTITGQSKAHQLAPAAAAMAGVAYTIDNGMVLDFGYRFAYLGQVDNSTNVKYSSTGGLPLSGITNANTRLTVGDTFEHTLRAGIRWNVW